jgi:hypothetical protein
MRRDLALSALSLALLALSSGPAHAAPFRFPATPSGPAEWRDERDVSSFLAAWKAESFQRVAARRAAATPNQAKYDVRWYDLDLTFTPASSQVSGSVRTRATVLVAPLTTLDLDLYSNMVIDQVQAGGVTVTWSRLGDVLTVNLNRTYFIGETVEVRVTYHGTPVAGSFGFQVVNGRQIIWSLSEPYGARTWWPCKDVPEDKADSVSIRYTVPSGMKTASNGTRREATDNGTVAVSRWGETYPIASYLVSIASYPYAQSLDWYKSSPTDSMRIEFYNYPESAPGVAAVQAKVKNMIAAYVPKFGAYPFLLEKYGHAEFPFSGGMEHQTCTSIGAFNEYVVAHELAHQWWGDKVTCRDFHHIWLNEGFATFGEGVWAENQGGLAAYHEDLDFNTYFGPGTVWVPDDQNSNRIFDSYLSYDKGSWVLHMLRRVLGDAVFFNALQQYGATNAYGTATTETFRAACEAASGRDLSKFFQQWVYGERYPVYHADWSAVPAAGGHDVTLVLEQRQTGPLFTMPVDVRIQTAGGPRDFVVPDSLASQAFVLHVDAAPLSLAIDPDHWILHQLDQDVTQPPFDRSVLVVNGVDWANYGTEITNAYNAKAFWGDYTIDFWDHFAAPAGGYPGTLPAPLGHGPVPPEVLGHYRNVIWVGNHFSGDQNSWIQTPIANYLNAGGNALLLTRLGEHLIGGPLLDYLGITFTQGNTTVLDCLATRPGLTNLTRTGTQSTVAVFDTVRSRPDTQLLYKTTSGFSPQRGLGVIRMPAAGAGLRAKGGRFAFVSGRPYRWTSTILRTNVMTILSQYFLEPLNGAGVPGAGATLSLAPLLPNPSRGARTVRFSLAEAGPVRLEVLDVMGRRVRSLVAGTLPAGPQARTWDGLDARGSRAAAGLYFVQLRAGGRAFTERFVQLP